MSPCQPVSVNSTFNRFGQYASSPGNRI